MHNVSMRALAVVMAAALGVGAASLGAQKKPQEPPKPPPLEPIAPLDVARLLDTYAAGRFNDAVSEVAKAGDTIGRNLRRHWMVDAPVWIDADPADRPHRLLVAASLALESEIIRVERGEWGVSGGAPYCPGSCVLDWAQTQLASRGAPDDAERAWLLAAAALAGGVRDWNYLNRPAPPKPAGRMETWVGSSRSDAVGFPPGPTEVPLPGLMNRALDRFPADPRLRLEHAMAAAARFNVTTEGGRNVPDIAYQPIIVTGGRISMPAQQTRTTQRETAIALLDALKDDPVVGPEASVRLGYLQWALGEDGAATASLVRAAAAAKDADTEYLARFLLGWTALVGGDSDAAIPHLRAALDARPGSQSASVALGALELQRGDAAAAYTLAQTSLDTRATDDDPWRLFLYGHHPHLSSLIAGLRKQVKP
jgi:hypothetical protein